MRSWRGHAGNLALTPFAVALTLAFTFYGTNDGQIGSGTETVNLGAADVAEIFEVRFDSGETVGGYSYALTIG